MKVVPSMKAVPLEVQLRGSTNLKSRRTPATFMVATMSAWAALTPLAPCLQLDLPFLLLPLAAMTVVILPHQACLKVT